MPPSPQSPQPQSPQQNTSFPPQAASPTEEFAPNAFTAPMPRATPEYAPEHPHWYDRILDIILGDDETQPKNRIVLICATCRLVNGQAPPGTRSLDELGKWRCSTCGNMNGTESEEKRLIRAVAGRGPEMGQLSPTRPTSAARRVSDGDDDDEAEDALVDREEPDQRGTEDVSIHTLDGADAESSPAASTRSKAKQRGKG